MLALSLTLFACSREDGPFAMSPLLSAHTDASAAMVATCIESRWADATRNVRIAVAKHSIRLSAKTFFAGVRIGARLKEESGHTTVEYFERRLADRRYLAMGGRAYIQKCRADPSRVTLQPHHEPQFTEFYK